VSSVPRFCPSTVNSTPVTPTLSDALAETTTAEPETVVFPPGAVRVTVGGVVSVGCGATETVTPCDAVPPLPVQVAVYVVFVVRGGVTKLPLVPLPPFETVHEVLFEDDQVMTEVPPYAMDEGDAEMVTVGEGSAEMVTVVFCAAVPPLPVQVRVYVVFEVGETDWVPDVVFVPVHPPLAVQLVLFVLLQVSVEDWFVVILDGAAVRVTVGVGITVTVTF
jgi:hypothetical protein